MIKINKPILKDSFSVDDIHKLRKYRCEKTKNFSSDIEAIQKMVNKYNVEMVPGIIWLNKEKVTKLLKKSIKAF